MKMTDWMIEGLRRDAEVPHVAPYIHRNNLMFTFHSIAGAGLKLDAQLRPNALPCYLVASPTPDQARPRWHPMSA